MQVRTCTTNVNVVVPTGAAIKLRARTTRNTGLPDRDALTLVCRL